MTQVFSVYKEFYKYNIKKNIIKVDLHVFLLGYMQVSILCV